MFCTKNLAILLSFLKEFTEGKKREKKVFLIINVFLIIKERKNSLPGQRFPRRSGRLLYVSQELFFRSIFQRCSQEVIELRN